MASKPKEAFEAFDKAIGIARTEAEIFNLLLNRETARAQLHAVTVFFVN
jgi:hypothetical protein